MFFERCGTLFSLLLVVACFLGRFGVFGGKVRVRSFLGTFLWLLGNMRNFLGIFVFQQFFECFLVFFEHLGIFDGFCRFLNIFRKKLG